MPWFLDGDKSLVPGGSHTSLLSLYMYLQLMHGPFASSVFNREENNFKNDAPEGTFPCLSGPGSCDLC